MYLALHDGDSGTALTSHRYHPARVSSRSGAVPPECRSARVYPARRSPVAIYSALLVVWAGHYDEGLTAIGRIAARMRRIFPRAAERPEAGSNSLSHLEGVGASLGAWSNDSTRSDPWHPCAYPYDPRPPSSAGPRGKERRSRQVLSHLREDTSMLEHRREDARDYLSSMDLFDAIQQRRSIKRFTSRPVTRTEIEKLLAAATLAPNHKLTQPWRFYVLGPEARYAYGAALGERKAKKAATPEAGRALRDTVANEHRALPAMIVVAISMSDNPEVAEENYGATMMAIENLALCAVDLGLGTHIKTGAVMADPAARAAAGVGEGERIVAVVNVGEPDEVPPPKQRNPASSCTCWLP